MELDEDHQNGPVNSWTLWEENYNKTIRYSDTCLDGNNREHSPSSDGNGNSNADFENFIESFKNNIFDQSRTNETRGYFSKNCLSKLKEITNEKDKNETIQVKKKMAEYTHYLGLKPTSKLNCRICDKTFDSDLNECMCLSRMLHVVSPNTSQAHQSQLLISTTSESSFGLEKHDTGIKSLTSISKSECIDNTETPLNIDILLNTNSKQVPYENNGILSTSISEPFSGRDTAMLLTDHNNELSTDREEFSCLSTSNLGELSFDNTQMPIVNNSKSLSADQLNHNSIENLELVDTNDSGQIFHKQSTINNESSLVNAKSESSTQVKPLSQSLNFKITRKVYLCAACETYFENWNLFLHMREVHKRHICLFCLGMFGQAERLSHHLAKKHNVPEITYSSQEEFHKEFQDSCYLMCCSCEKLFLETDNFYHHTCQIQFDQKTPSDTYSVYKQVASHPERCSLYPRKSQIPFVQNTSNVLREHSMILSKTETCTRRQSKRTIKCNRLNDDVYLYTKLIKRTRTQSLTETTGVSQSMSLLCVQKSEVTESALLESSVSKDDNSKNVNELSKIKINVGNSGNNKYTNRLHQINSNKDTNKFDLFNDHNVENIYDSITETIMEVPQCESPFNIMKVQENIGIDTSEHDLDRDIITSLDLGTEADVSFDVKNNQVKKDSKDFRNEPNLKCKEFNSDSESQISNSSQSNHGNKYLDSVNTKTVNASTDHMKPLLESGSNATSVTDRSLIIKICTKNNSVFSISAPSIHKTNSNIPEYNADIRESEENNNSGASKSESMLLETSHADLLVNEENNDKLAIDNTRIDTVSHVSDIVEDLKQNNSDYQDANLNQFTKGNDRRNDDCNNVEIDFNGILLAGEEIPIIDLNFNKLLENMDIEELLKCCIQAVCDVCVYCNHARHIAVNGKELSLHMLSEHRFQPQHPVIIMSQDQFIARVKRSLKDLESYYFNLNSYNSNQGTYNISSVKAYECFHCRYHSTSHKELYLHNRKMHQKPILICIMCKSTFHSYSELICHLCPGVYAANVNIQYRCCLCPLSKFPSAFRLMVHLRKQHHACDVCLETTGNQQRLSNHVWKHKLHHLCYRCGIAYRNKPDITKHLFWKHGTESVLCKKCLQKKWPHIYHFCIPPTSFVCEDCGYSFSRAVALKVHRRSHTNDFPYSCSECSGRYISKKLLAKHERAHKEPEPSFLIRLPDANVSLVSAEEEIDVDVCNTELKEDKEEGRRKEEDEEKYKEREEHSAVESIKKVVDVYDLPPLNLSSDSDTEIDEEREKSDEISKKLTAETILKLQDITVSSADLIVEVERNEEEKKQQEQIMDGIWDNFKSYTASLEKQDRSTDDLELARNIALVDHDYCVKYMDENKVKNYELEISCQNKELEELSEKTPQLPSPSKKFSTENNSSKKKSRSPKKKKQLSTSSSGSSSDSNSSNCSCGSDCSCSSSASTSSSSSSSSSDSDSISSESPHKSISKLKREMERKEEKVKVSEEFSNKSEFVKQAQVDPITIQIMESDLDTSETETDEDFYDENPQQFANKLLSEKCKNMQNKEAHNGVTERIMISAMNPSVYKNSVTSESKRKVRKHKKKNAGTLKLNISKTSMNPGRRYSVPVLQVQSLGGSSSETDGKRSSKRKRVPKRFYGDSSDEESQHRQQMMKWRRVDSPSITREKQQELDDESVLVSAVSENVSSSSDSDSELERNYPPPHSVANVDRSSNLYCYCQCPYDEVSEMIACDGDNCQIEWFHFECVGITVPPKGKWYCPDCRRRLGIPDDYDDFTHV